MTPNDLDSILPAPTRELLTKRLTAALAGAGFPATVELVAEQPMELAASAPYRVVGSRGGAHVPALGVVLCPEPPCSKTAAAWAGRATGAEIVHRVASQLVPAHVALRVLYRRLDRKRSWRTVDPLRLGQARLGRILMKEVIRMTKRAPSTDALLIELFADLRELYGIDIDPAADPAAWDDLIRRDQKRQQQQHHDGDWFDAQLVNNLVNRLEALERLVGDLVGNGRPGRRKSPRQPSDIPVNR